MVQSAVMIQSAWRKRQAQQELQRRRQAQEAQAEAAAQQVTTHCALQANFMPRPEIIFVLPQHDTKHDSKADVNVQKGVQERWSSTQNLTAERTVLNNWFWNISLVRCWARKFELQCNCPRQKQTDAM